MSRSPPIASTRNDDDDEDDDDDDDDDDDKCAYLLTGVRLIRLAHERKHRRIVSVRDIDRRLAMIIIVTFTKRRRHKASRAGSRTWDHAGDSKAGQFSVAFRFIHRIIRRNCFPTCGAHRSLSSRLRLCTRCGSRERERERERGPAIRPLIHLTARQKTHSSGSTSRTAAPRVRSGGRRGRREGPGDGDGAGTQKLRLLHSAEERAGRARGGRSHV